MNEADEVRRSSGPAPTRRGFLKASGLSALGLSLGGAAVAGATPRCRSEERSVILLMLVGGPSQLETFDPKPDAPAEVRGPFGSIATSVPGVRINEHLPKLAVRMDRATLVRSLHHDAAPIHETGLQLLQTGHLCRLGGEQPHLGALAARALGSGRSTPPFVVLPRLIGNTGVGVSHGQSAGTLGTRFDPLVFDGDGDPASDRRARAALPSEVRQAFDLDAEPDEMRDAYGRNAFGQNCLRARRLVESGVRVVTVNMFDSVFNRVTWDSHGAAPFSTLDDYKGTLLPTLDSALSALLDDLDRLGRLESTLVVATGEFGRTPRLNASGGRDHWPAVWSAWLAGGGTRGGQVIGASDAHAAEPVDRPVTAPELFATMAHSLGIRASATLAGDDRAPVEPILEALA